MNKRSMEIYRADDRPFAGPVIYISGDIDRLDDRHERPVASSPGDYSSDAMEFPATL